jgi:hypothetical protein
MLQPVAEEAKNCHAYITLKGYNQTIITGWNDNNLQYMDIGDTGELRLFTIMKWPTKKEIIFYRMPRSNNETFPPMIKLPYDTFIDK